MKDDFLLCEYFNAREQCIHRILITTDDKTTTEIERSEIGQRTFAKRLAALKAKANADQHEQPASLQDCATAVQALLVDVTSARMTLARARTMTHVRVNFSRAVAIADIIPALETSYGGHSASWAKAVFSGLKDGPVGVH